MGRPTKAGDWVTQVNYKPDNREKDYTVASGVKTTYSYNDRSMLESIQYSSLVNLNDQASNVTLSYSYDGNTNVTAVIDSRPNHNKNYQYDNNNWLIGGSVSGQSLSVRYDLVGNITYKSYGQSTFTYLYDSKNRMSNIEGSVYGSLANLLEDESRDTPQAFTYDSYGNISSRDGSGTGMIYNDAKQLVEATGINPYTGKSYHLYYYYDALGNRVAVVDESETYYEIYNGQNKLLYKLGYGKITNYLYLNGRKVAESTHEQGSQATPATSTFFHSDLLGSVILKSKIDGSIIDTSGNGQNYLPYGAELNPGIYTNTLTGLVGEHIGFINKPFNSNSGLSYLEARYYDPLLGRFMGVDLVDFSADAPMTFNRYAYSWNNPVTLVDPNGNTPFFIDVAIGTVGSAAIGAYQGYQRTGTAMGAIKEAAKQGAIGLGVSLVTNSYAAIARTAATTSGSLIKAGIAKVEIAAVEVNADVAVNMTSDMLTGNLSDPEKLL